MIDMIVDARKTALNVLNELDKGRKTLDGVLEVVIRKNSFLEKRDRALLNALVYGVLRWRNRIDWIIGHFSKIRIDKIDPKVLNTLRIGLFQIIYLSRIPVSAAVDTSVEMVKPFAGPWVVRYVNAVLRTAAKGYKNVPFPDLDKDPVSALSATASFPEWLIKRWLYRFGLIETKALCNAINTIPPITVRTNTLLTTRLKLTTSLEDNTEKLESTSYAPDGICFFNPKAPVPEIRAFKDGWFQVQDEAAQLVSLLLNPQPGETILDACAGLGGKTGHIAQMLKNRGRIIAMDQNKEKLMQLASEMSRLGISTVTPCVYNLNEPLSRNRFGMFDRILLDAPCSGLGTIRRNPDAKWSMSKKNLGHYKKRQLRFLDNLTHLIKPSGILVYAVCSMEPEEGNDIVKKFLNKHSEYAIIDRPPGLPNKLSPFIDKNGHLKTFPHIHNMDGFFAVCLKRIP